MKLELIAATTFGLEAVVRREIEALGYKIIKTEDGRVIFEGSERAIVRANLWLRSADRVQIIKDKFGARHPEGGGKGSHRQAERTVSHRPFSEDRS